MTNLYQHFFSFLIGVLAVNLAPTIKNTYFKHFPKTLNSLQQNPSISEVEQWPHEKKIHTFHNKIHVAVGYALANVVFIETEEGLILIDVTESNEALVQIFSEVKFHKKPTKLHTLIYTHHHPDHTFGGLGVYDILNSFGQHRSSLQVIAHDKFIKEFNRVITNVKMTYSRGASQFGNLLPEDLQINAGIGKRVLVHPKTKISLVRPTKTFTEKLGLNIGGVELELVHAPGETDDQINIILPEFKTVIAGDNIYPAFPNLYAIRGVPTRDTKTWSNSVRLINEYSKKFGEDTVLIGMHGPPLSLDVEKTTKVYSDAIQFVHDQTVRLMNQGLSTVEIVNEVKSLYPFWDEYYLREQYGTLEWSIKGIVSHYVGWFDGNVKNLKNYDSHDEKWVTSLGGCEKIVKKVENLIESEDKNDWLHALELSNFCQKLDTKSDSNSIHSSIQSDLLKKLANSESSPLARNFYLTSPNSGLNVDTSFPNEMQVAAISDPDYLDIEVLFDSMTTKILPSVGIDNWVLKIDLVDIKRQFILYLSNKVLRRVDDFVEFEANSTITCSEDDFRKVLANPLNAVGRLLDGSIEVEGGKMSLINFLRNLKP